MENATAPPKVRFSMVISTDLGFWDNEADWQNSVRIRFLCGRTEFRNTIMISSLFISMPQRRGSWKNKTRKVKEDHAWKAYAPAGPFRGFGESEPQNFWFFWLQKNKEHCSNVIVCNFLYYIIKKHENRAYITIICSNITTNITMW